MLMMTARDEDTFQEMYATLAMAVLMADPFDRGEVHAQKVTTPDMVTKEINDRVLQIDIYRKNLEHFQSMVKPNLPWAEDHFLERVSGEPLNPPPSESYWPFAQQGNAAHKKDQQFSHTYPERFWPRHAGEEADQAWDISSPTNRGHWGIRYRYGDLEDLVKILQRNSRSRQAYLPVWFPEDLAAADAGLRVPCTLGYHFQLQRDDYLHMSYYMRSCDLVRFFRDDVYMAGRLLQWVAHETGMRPGKMMMYIANIHAFEGDRNFLESVAYTGNGAYVDKRNSYNFEGLS